MDVLLDAADVARVIKQSERKARDLMKTMHHIPRPLRVPEWALNEWISANMVAPNAERPKPGRPRAVAHVMRGADGKYHVPRTREAALAETKERR